MRIVMVIFLLLFSRLCAADESLYVGHLDHIKMSPYNGCGNVGKQSRVDRAEPVDIDDICISNICAKAETVYIIDRTIFGKPRKSVTLTTYVGEFCRPEFDMGTGPRLVHVARNLKGDSATTSQRLESTGEGKEFFFPLYIDKIRNVEMHGLLKPLDEGSRFVSELDSGDDGLEWGLKAGFVKKEAGKYTWYRGVYLEDLERQLRL